MDDFVFEKGRKDQSLAMITARIESGLTIKKWCELHGITTGTYDYHAYKLRKMGLYPGCSKADGTGDAAGSGNNGVSSYIECPEFMEIPVSKTGNGITGRDAGISVECGPFRISVGPSASRGLIRDVLEVAAGVH